MVSASSVLSHEPQKQPEKPSDNVENYEGYQDNAWNSIKKSPEPAMLALIDIKNTENIPAVQ